jgi:predicted SAM-dependent methyltransferase
MKSAILSTLRDGPFAKRRRAYLCSRLLYECLPSPVRSGVTKRLGRSWQSFCPVCESKVRAFAPLPELYSEGLKNHGSDLQLTDFETCNFEAYQCPHCGASDRDRLYTLYLASRLPLDPAKQQSFRLLDIAPAAALSRHIRRKYNIRYRTADLFQKGVDDRVDVTRMDGYADGSFDAFICSHVLEHVENDRMAMSELYRVLKPGGWGISMAPINLRATDVLENAAVITAEERWRLFGQGDHLRLYSREGFINRLMEAGFVVREFREESFGSGTMRRCGLSASSVLYVTEKPKQTC